jgi:hypothetical protein
MKLKLNSHGTLTCKKTERPLWCQECHKSRTDGPAFFEITNKVEDRHQGSYAVNHVQPLFCTV